MCPKFDKDGDELMACGCMKGFDCIDCSACTQCLDEYYMLQHEIWLKIKGDGNKKGMLCIPCAERRLGRALTFEDFLPGVPINWSWRQPRSKLLKLRLRTRA